ANRTWNGQIDEVRMSNAARSGDWIAAEYANQTSPSTFYSIGTENGVTIGVTPATATLYSGQSQQFTAPVFGACNAAVTWSANPSGVGTFTANGLYTAPSSVGTTQSIAVTAVSQADPSKTA